MNGLETFFGLEDFSILSESRLMSNKSSKKKIESTISKDSMKKKKKRILFGKSIQKRSNIHWNLKKMQDDGEQKIFKNTKRINKKINYYENCENSLKLREKFIMEA